MKKSIPVFLCLLCSWSALSGQETFSVSGLVADSLTREPLPGATLLLTGESTGVLTDEQGQFSFRTGSGHHQIQLSYIGYHPKTVAFILTRDTTLNLGLSAAPVEAGAVIVTARNPTDQTGTTKTGVVELTGKEIRKLPALMGESDLIRVLRSSPGMQNAGDGNSGFYVRGGNVDQNLIMLDNALVFNPSHVLGFFSVFNPEAIGSASLIKSGMPAQYGGRLSSVLAVKTTDGDFEHHHASANIGLIYTNLSVQGPLIKNKLSYFLAIRKTYINQLATAVTRLFQLSDTTGIVYGNKYSMSDLNAKITWKPGNRNRISLLYYTGSDFFSLNRPSVGYSSRIKWGNTLSALNWNHIRTDSIYTQHSLNYSRYLFDFVSGQFILNLNLYSAVHNLNYRYEYNHGGFLGGSLKSGVDLRFYRFIPNKFRLTVNEADVDYGSYQDLYASESSGFASWEKDLTDRLRIYAGLRLTWYTHFGPYTQVEASDQAGLTDTLTYGKGEPVKSYANPEPRFSLRYNLTSSSSVKASYTRNYQYIHVVSSGSVSLPSDIWIPSTNQIRPQYGDQFTLGYYRNQGKDWTASAEIYYKGLQSQVEMLYGLGVSAQETSFERGVVTGRGYAGGFELYLLKHNGKLTGSLAYSLAKSMRQFDNINRGLWYPAKYDRRHEANVTAMYRLSERAEVSAAFVYATGNAMTVPEQKYFIEGNLINVYGKTNSFRMPSYHRLDVSFTWHFRPRYFKESSLNLSVFNVYNRANPFLLFFEVNGNIAQYNLEIRARQISVFPILPSVSWNVKL